MKKATAIFLILLLSVIGSYAQDKTYYHNEFWTKTIVSIPVHPKLNIDTDYQHRRQNYKINDIHLFETPLLNSFRFGLSYKTGSKLLLSFFPFSYFYTSPLIGKVSDYTKEATEEYRIAVCLEHKQKVNRIELKNRYGYESRWIKQKSETSYLHYNRLRWRLFSELSLSEKDSVLLQKIHIYASNEVFINQGNNFKISQIFDQNRVALGINYQLNKHIKIDTGFQYIFKVRKNTTEADIENIWFFNTIFTL